MAGSTSTLSFGRSAKSIQRGVITVGIGTTATATITAVDVTKTELRFLGGNTGGGNNSGNAVLTNSTTITADNTGGSGSPKVSWELTEFY